LQAAAEKGVGTGLGQGWGMPSSKRTKRSGKTWRKKPKKTYLNHGIFLYL